MLVPDTEKRPYFEDLCNAANQIAALKAQISKLEKVVDAAMAQHLAGQQPDYGMSSALLEDQPEPVAPAPDASITDANITDADATDENIDETLGFEPESEDHDDIETSEVTAPAQEAHPTAEVAHFGALPSAVKSLICNPLLHTAAEQDAAAGQDDLTLIRGIDHDTAQLLAESKLTSFRDISELDRTAIDQLSDQMDQPHSIHRDGWIEQAAILADGETTAFSRQTLEARELETRETGDEIEDQADVTEILEFENAAVTTDEEISDTQDDAIEEIEEIFPRIINIDLSHIRTGTPNFVPSVEMRYRPHVQRIIHQTPKQVRDFSSFRAIAASLIATAVIFGATTATDSVELSSNISTLIHDNICQMTGLAMFPDVCHQLIGALL